MVTIFVIYLVVVMAVAIYSSRFSKTSADFILGGKKISGISLALSERATSESAWLILGLTGFAFLEGFQGIWVALGCISGVVIIWFVMGERLRKLSADTGTMTIPGLIASRFPNEKKTINYLSAFIILFFFMFYIAGQFAGAGIILHDTFGLEKWWGVIVGSVIVIIYCMMGGFITVVATDVLQAILMINTLVVLPAIALTFAFSHQIHIVETIRSASEQYLSPTSGLTGVSGVLLVLSGISWAFGFTGQPQLLTRMMAIRNNRDMKIARWVAIVWTLLAYSGALLIGFIGYAFIHNGFLDASLTGLDTNAEKILPAMMMLLVSPVVAGILLSGAISAMMSTASSELVVCSSAITVDILPFFRKKEITAKTALRTDRIMTLLVGAMALLLAVIMSETVYGFVSYAWSGIGSSFGPLLILLLFWKRFSAAGAIASLISGCLSTVVWKMWFSDVTGISERLVSFVFAFMMAVLFSLILPVREKGENKVSLSLN